jgi:hypothetical protein
MTRHAVRTPALLHGEVDGLMSERERPPSAAASDSPLSGTRKVQRLTIPKRRKLPQHPRLQLKEAGMGKGPACEFESPRLLGAATRPQRCPRCGARWIQGGAEQRGVRRFDASSSNISGVFIHPARPLVVLSGRRTA